MYHLVIILKSCLKFPTSSCHVSWPLVWFPRVDVELRMVNSNFYVTSIYGTSRSILWRWSNVSTVSSSGSGPDLSSSTTECVVESTTPQPISDSYQPTISNNFFHIIKFHNHLNRRHHQFNATGAWSTSSPGTFYQSTCGLHGIQSQRDAAADEVHFWIQHPSSGREDPRTSSPQHSTTQSTFGCTFTSQEPSTLSFTPSISQKTFPSTITFTSSWLTPTGDRQAAIVYSAKPTSKTLLTTSSAFVQGPLHTKEPHSIPWHFHQERSWEFHHSQVCLSSSTKPSQQWWSPPLLWQLLKTTYSPCFLKVATTTLHRGGHPGVWFLSSRALLWQEVEILGENGRTIPTIPTPHGNPNGMTLTTSPTVQPLHHMIQPPNLSQHFPLHNAHNNIPSDKRTNPMVTINPMALCPYQQDTC